MAPDRQMHAIGPQASIMHSLWCKVLCTPAGKACTRSVDAQSLMRPGVETHLVQDSQGSYQCWCWAAFRTHTPNAGPLMKRLCWPPPVHPHHLDDIKQRKYCYWQAEPDRHGCKGVQHGHGQAGVLPAQTCVAWDGQKAYTHSRVCTPSCKRTNTHHPSRKRAHSDGLQRRGLSGAPGVQSGLLSNECQVLLGTPKESCCPFHFLSVPKQMCFWDLSMKTAHRGSQVWQRIWWMLCYRTVAILSFPLC